MQSRDKIDKIPTFCPSYQSLLPGDILIFDYAPRLPGRSKNSGSYFTVQQQGFLNERGGHRAAVHAGFIVETAQGMKLAHLIGSGFDLADLDSRSPEYSKFMSRTTHVYRPRKNRAQIAAQLAALVTEIHMDRGANLHGRAKIKWTAGVAVRSFLHRLFGSLKIDDQNPVDSVVDRHQILPETVISKESICSRFVADAYVSACHRMTNKDGVDHRKHLMNISNWTLPKTLQAYLYRNPNFDYLVMPHTRNQLYEKLQEVITGEIQRILKNIELDDIFPPFTREQQKARDLFDALQQFNWRTPHEDDQIKKSIALIKALSPILKRNTGINAITPMSYRAVMAFAKKEGIHRENFDYDLHDRHENKIRKLAREKYHYSKPLAKLYATYRNIGYSDDEAKFECNPSFGEWYKLSPVRNTILTCSILGFFLWVLPRGLTQTFAADKRNQLHTSHAPMVR
jgi:N-acetylmuramoyl-L-alanine amidase